MMFPIGPHTHPSLSQVSAPVNSAWLTPADRLFERHQAIRLLSLEDIRSVLEACRTELDSRRVKVAALATHLENHEAIRCLTRARTSEFDILLKNLEAESEQCDRLAMAIRGLERAVEWRRNNPVKGA